MTRITYLLPAAAGILVLASAAIARELIMKPGRYEVTGRIDYGAATRPGRPPADDIREFSCLTEPLLTSAKVPMSLPEGCAVKAYRAEGAAHVLVAKCEDYELRIRMDRQSSDSFALTVTMHGGDVDGIVSKQVARFVGACTATELAEADDAS